jgi:ribosomal protein S18 acetylase RimI-like enzyme
MITREAFHCEEFSPASCSFLLDQNSRITFRQLIKADLPALEWDGEYKHYRRLYKDVFTSMQAGEAVMWVVDHNGEGIIGQLFVQLIGARRDLADGGNRVYIYGFRMKPDFRNMKIGSKFLNFVTSDIIKRGFSKIYLNVGKHNPNARRFYERHGYSVDGDEPGRWTYIDHKGRIQNVVEPSWRLLKQVSFKVK